MAWSDELIPMVRAMVDDLSTPYRYDDTQVTQLVVLAARLVSMEATFPVAFVANVGSLTITPDPTADPRDENFINLTAGKAACILSQGAAAKAAGRALRVKDLAVDVDTRAEAEAWAELLKSGWCAVYKQMLIDYKTGRRGMVVGAAIMGPLRVAGASAFPLR